MSTKKQILSNKVDPGFHEIKDSLAKRSDAFPVILLPIRLETRFVKNTKVTAVRSDKIHESMMGFIHQGRQLIYLAELLKLNQEKLNQAQLNSQIKKLISEIQLMNGYLRGIDVLEKSERALLIKVTKEISNAFSELKLPNNFQKQLEKELAALDKSLASLKLEKTKNKSSSGLYNSIHRLSELMTAIYQDRSINSLELDKTLSEVDRILKEIPTMINQGKIESDPDLIKKIGSEISHIKRLHKHSPITLNTYKTGYPGRINLTEKEKELRDSIHVLKSKIDAEYIPYMNLISSLRTQKVLFIIDKIEHGYFKLKLENQNKPANTSAWNKIQTSLNNQLKKILDELNQPLEGSTQEMERFKTLHQKYSSEIEKFKETGEALLRKENTPATQPPKEEPKDPRVPDIRIPGGRIPPIPNPTPAPTPRPTVTIPTANPSVIRAVNPRLPSVTLAPQSSAVSTERVATAIPAKAEVNPKIILPDLSVTKKASLGTNNQFIEEFLALKGQLNILNSLGVSSKSLRDGAKNAYTNELELRQLTSSFKTRASQNKELIEWTLEKVRSLENKIRIRSANTGILTQQTLDAILGAYQSLQNHYNQSVARLPENRENVAVEETLTLFQSIHLSIQNQYTDQKNNRTAFAKDYINQIRYLVESSVKYELWIRFFPDDIAVDDHDERLTEDEIELGKNYFRNAYLNSEDIEKTRLAAWRGLAASVGIRRAAYIVQALYPSSFNIPTAIKNPLEELNLIFMRQFKPFLEDQRYFLSVQVSVLQELSALINRYGASLGAFTPALETKSSLLQSISILQKLNANLKIEPQLLREADAGIVSRIRMLQATVNSRLNAFISFKTENAGSLEKPFDQDYKYKEVERKDKSWDRAGVCNTLPDRMIVGLKNGNIYEYLKIGNRIPDILQLSLDPNDDSESNFSHDSKGDLRVPESLKWMFDFEEAVKVGMGMKIEIEENDYNNGFDRVIVTGIKDESAEKGQQRINELFENHHYTDGGLELLEVDSPTNNSEEAKSIYSELDDDVDFAYEALIKEIDKAQIDKPYSTLNAIEIKDGQYFKDALGLENDFAIRIPKILKSDIAEGKAMNRALYNATIKYFMKTMAKNLFNTMDEIRTLEFMQNHLSAVGSIPSFRIGPQPYGILPITVYDNFITGSGASEKGSLMSYIRNLSKLGNIIRKDFEDVMENDTSKVRDINHPLYSNDPQKYFLEILGLEPNGKEYLYRHGTNIMGRVKEPEELPFNPELNSYLISVNWDTNIQKFSPIQVNNLVYPLLEALGHTTQHAQLSNIRGTRAYKARYNFANQVLGPTVQDNDLPQERLATLQGHEEGYNYISWLRDNRSSITDIKIENLPKVLVDGDEKTQTTLLLAMLRGGLVYDRSHQVVNSLNILEGLPVPKLERLLADHIDLCSHRVDAWLEGLSAWRLRQMRSTQKKGSYIGAYGILENLRPQHGTIKSENVPDGLRPEAGYPVYKFDDNQGFIHGPSIQHATTAAVLRAGFNAMKEREGNDKNILSINLSSSRVRKALTLLQGVSQGQSTGALLGYQFERALHEKYKFRAEDGTPGNHLEMDVFIYRLRRKFPTYGDRPIGSESETASNESIRPNNVVDGLALMQHFESHLTSLGVWDPDMTLAEIMVDGNWGNLEINHIPTDLINVLPNISDSNPNKRERNKQKMLAIIKEIDEMIDAFDALSDLITSESVYQLVRGNHQRAAGVMNNFAEGQIPRDPEIIKSLRNGHMVINRGLFLIPDLGNEAVWGMSSSPKSSAEPRLNLYFANQIGNPEFIQFSVVHQGNTHYLSLLDIGLQPIDLVFLLGRDTENKWEELEFRVIQTLQNEGFETEGDYHFSFTDHIDEGAQDLFSSIPFFEALFNIINSGRALDSRDFRRAEHPDNFQVDGAGLDINQYLGRLEAIINRFEALYSDLAGFDVQQTSYTASEVDLGYTLFKKLAQFGFTDYFPNPLLDKTTFFSEQFGKLMEAKDRISLRVHEIRGLQEDLALETEYSKILNIADKIIEEVFGKGMRILPRVKIPDKSFWQARIQENPETGLLQHIGLDGLEKWQHDTALVRKNFAQLENFRMLQEVLNKPETSVIPAQIPLSDQVPVAPYWVAAEYPESFDPEGDYLSFMLYGAENISVGDHAVGLVIDEWVELIPQKNQTTGIAVHYNQPDARAPQSILMAVPPEMKGSLDLDQILLTVEEALNLAKLRTFEPDDIDNSSFAQLLPATSALAYGYFEFLRASEEDQDPDQQSLGWYIDYSITNHDQNPSES
ncbi:hypothetical protein A33Q_3542 [Indibacter alkaliphilus LW1]|uniref:Uncharacterized protein n=1 Tax=Indibacter alkaliphilus (strain CCUG 57479 / KCTC 22604 / LW1) TaxID=1189612 RepID=S2DNT4_INDAL|nr:hypothetical protein [Indibacter alkaliphilus]EOZ93596.1 hypothetical protein A33Q_3542 [Indibacter alkaliphilus LW1]